MVRYIPLIALFLTLQNLAAQEEKTSPLREGLLRAQATISFGYLNELEQKSLYLHGNLEYYTTPMLALRGDIYHYLKPSDESSFDKNHQLFAGASYHFGWSNSIDPYIALQPGFALTEYSDRLFKDSAPTPTVSTLISVAFGFNYFASKWFHLFIDGRYVYGQDISTLGSISINEYRLSFGLGFNINTK